MSGQRLIARDTAQERFIGCAGCITVAQLEQIVSRVKDADGGHIAACPIADYGVAVRRAVRHAQISEFLCFAAA